MKQLSAAVWAVAGVLIAMALLCSFIPEIDQLTRIKFFYAGAAGIPFGLAFYALGH